ncbi:MAG: hypothetical protein QW369_03520 [Desulfurococcaceae archaeon]
MIASIIILIGSLLSLLATVVSNTLSRRRYFIEAIEFLSKVRSNEVGKDKRSIRKMRKVKGFIEKYRRRMFVLFMINFTVFMLSYTAAVVTTYFAAYYLGGGDFYVTLPIYIPLVSYSMNGLYRVGLVILVLLGFLAPSYLFTKASKLYSM